MRANHPTPLLTVLILSLSALPLMGKSCETTTTEQVLDARLVGSWQNTQPGGGEYPTVVFTMAADGLLTRLTSRHTVVHDDFADELTLDGTLYTGPSSLLGLWHESGGDSLALFQADDTYELEEALPQTSSTLERGTYTVNGTDVSLVGTELGQLTAYEDDGTFVSRGRGMEYWSYALTGGTGSGGNVLQIQGQLLTRVSGLDGGPITGGWETTNTTGERHGFDFSDSGVLTHVQDYIDVSFVRTYRELHSYESFVEDNTIVSVGERLVGTYELNDTEDILTVTCVFPSTGRYASITTGGAVLILGTPTGTASYDRTLGTGNVMNGTWEANGGNDVWTFDSTTGVYTHTITGTVVETGQYTVVSGQNWVELNPTRVFYRQ